MRNVSTLHSTPAWRDVIEAELRSVGLAVRKVGGAAVLVMVGLMLVLRIDALRQGSGISLHPELALLIALFAPLLPIAVWKGGYDFRRSYLASLPVDRTRHVLTKVMAGWVWLMVMAAAFLLGMIALAVVTGGEVGADEMRVVAADLPSGIPPGEAAALARRWRTPLWQWVVFFTGPTVGYLLGSAVVLAGSRTRRWLAGIVVVYIFLSIADGEVTDLGWVAKRIDMIIVMIVEGRYGLEALFAMGDAHNSTMAAGEGGIVWSDLPDLELWIAVTLFWTALAAASVLAVIWGDRKS